MCGAAPLAGAQSRARLPPSPFPLRQDAGLNKAYVFAAMMFVAPVVGTLCAGQSNRLSIGTQIMVRSELTASIYRKALRLRWAGLRLLVGGWGLGRGGAVQFGA